MRWPQLSALKSVGWHPSSERFLGAVPPYLISNNPLAPIRSPGIPDTHCIFSLACYASRNGLASLDVSAILSWVCFTSMPPTVQGLEWEWASFLLSFAACKPFLLPPPSKTQILWNINPSPLSLPCCIHPLMMASYGPTAFPPSPLLADFLAASTFTKLFPRLWSLKSLTSFTPVHFSRTLTRPYTAPYNLQQHHLQNTHCKPHSRQSPPCVSWF